MHTAQKYSKITLTFTEGVDTKYTIDFKDSGLVITGNHLIIVNDSTTHEYDESSGVDREKVRTKGFIYNLDRVVSYKTEKYK